MRELIKHILFSLMIALFIFTSNKGTAQEMTMMEPFSSEIALKVSSAELVKFDKPVRVGPGKRAIEYNEALVLKIIVDGRKFDSLPPDIEPFLYIGSNEYHIFHIDRPEKGDKLILTFHIRNWSKLKDGARLVLTINHGEPVRNPQKYLKTDVLQFKKEMIIDKR